MADEQELHLLCIGTDPDVVTALNADMKDPKIHTIGDMEGFENFLENPSSDPIFAIFCGNEIEDLNPDELAQSLRMEYQAETPIFYITKNREGFERKNYIKNGFTDAFILPFDAPVFKFKIQELYSKFSSGEIKVFRPVKLIDIEPGESLDFDLSIFMPRNQKYIKMTNAGDSMDQSQMDKLQKHNMNSMYVDINDMPKFYDYTAKRLTKLGAPSGSISETERQEKLQGAVRDIITGVFNNTAQDATIAEGKAIVEDCENIVKSYILNNNPSEWYKKLEETMTETSDAYSHSSAVSAYAGLFSIGLQIGKPEEFAIAGMFHDLGLIGVPQEIQDKDIEEMTPDELELYKLHPEMTIKIMKERKLIVPPMVHNVVMQHHERHNGTGFPKGAEGKRIRPESKILILADQFDYMTRKREGKTALTPMQALKKMRADGILDGEFLDKVEKVIPEEMKNQSEAS